MNITVYPCGTQVELNACRAVGYITAISIRQSAITYEISYFMNNTFLSSWFCDFEFSTEKPKLCEVGFIQENT